MHEEKGAQCELDDGTRRSRAPRMCTGHRYLHARLGVRLSRLRVDRSPRRKHRERTKVETGTRRSQSELRGRAHRTASRTPGHGSPRLVESGSERDDGGWDSHPAAG
jgi:hypothetical protein